MSETLSSSVKPVVSVIIPLYNTEKYIAECLDSVLNQTLREFEVLVVDDGSRDRSARIVEEIAGRDGRVRLLRHPGGVNLRVSRTRRLGIEEASGDYIAFLDADDAFEPSKLERQVGLMKAHPACVMCHTGILAVTVLGDDPEQSRLLQSEAKFHSDSRNHFRPEMTEYSSLDRPDALSSNNICNSSVLAVAEAVRSAPAATRQLFQYEDWLQWTLLSTKGTFVYTPERLTRYRLHPESSSYPIQQNYLRHLYAMIEFLLTLNILADDPGLKIRAESELIINLARLAAIYAEWNLGESSSRAEPPRPLDQFAESFGKQSLLQHQLKVNELNDRVSFLTERLATIRSSTVYQCLVKARNFFAMVKPNGLFHHAIRT